MSATAIDSAPSEFKAGWKVLVAAAIGIACGASPVPYNALGALTKPIAEDTGWNRGEIQASILFFSAAVIGLSLVFGTLVDRYGVRRVALLSTLGFGIGFGAIAFSPENLYAFWFLWALAGVIGGASIPISWTRGINSWFVRNRGLALALGLLGTGITGMFIPVYATWLVGLVGWRGAVIGLSLLPLCIGLPIAYWLFREPRAHERPAAAMVAGQDVASVGITLREAARQPRFWMMVASFGAVALAFGGLFTNYIPMLTDKGFDPVHASFMQLVIGLSIICGRLVAGLLIDRFWAPAVAFPMLALPSLSCWLLTGDTISTSQAVVAATLIGFAAGAESDLIAFMAAKYFGLKHYGKVYASLYMPFAIASAISPMAYGYVQATYRTYNPMLWVAAGLFVFGALVLLGVGRYPERR